MRSRGLRELNTYNLSEYLVEVRADATNKSLAAPSLRRSPAAPPGAGADNNPTFAGPSLAGNRRVRYTMDFRHPECQSRAKY